MGTSESFMHHSTSDRCWPNYDTGAANLRVSFGENRRSEFNFQGLLPTQNGSSVAFSEQDTIHQNYSCVARYMAVGFLLVAPLHSQHG